MSRDKPPRNQPFRPKAPRPPSRAPAPPSDIDGDPPSEKVTAIRNVPEDVGEETLYAYPQNEERSIQTKVVPPTAATLASAALDNEASQHTPLVSNLAPPASTLPLGARSGSVPAVQERFEEERTAMMVDPSTTTGDSPNATLALGQRTPFQQPPEFLRPPNVMASPPIGFAPMPQPQHAPPPMAQGNPEWVLGTGPQMQAPPRPPSGGMPLNPPYANSPSAPPARAASRAREASDDAPPSGRTGAGPGSFSRIFLGSVEKYRGKTGHVGSASQEAASALGQAAGSEEKVASGPTLKLRSPLALIEALVLTLILPAIGWLTDHNDPFFLNHHFSWIVAAPLLLGLRHGFAPALASAVVLDGLIAAAWRTHFVPMDRLPGETMIGLAALAMITGQFSDVWKRELVRLDGGFEVLRKQLGEVMRAHFLLELSHDRLEERMGKGTPNLRDALVAVHRAVAVRQGGTLADLSDALTEIFATYTMIEVGAVYRMDGDRVVPEPVAKIGRPAPFDPNDEQVKEALETKKLTFIRGGASIEAASSRTKLLAAVPFVDARRKLHGLLTVESIPLLAFEPRNLEALAILGGRFADAVASGGQDVGLQRGQRKELEIRLKRALRDLVESDVASTLFVLLVRKGGAASDSIETVLGGTLRALDFPYIERDAVGNYVVYILLPLTDEAGARSFGARIERIVRREGSMPLARAGAFNFHHVLRPDDTVEGVMTRLGAKAKLDEASVEHTIVV
jgi:hypothetical protein